MTNKIVAIQGNNPSKLNPVTDTSVFLAHEIQNKNYKIFYYDPKDLSIICLLYTSPSPRDRTRSRMPSSA